MVDKELTGLSTTTVLADDDIFSVRKVADAEDKSIKWSALENQRRPTDSSVAGTMSTADFDKLVLVEDQADVTDASNVNAAGAVMETDYDANSVLAATTDDTPTVVTLAEQRVLGRITSGNITGLTAAEIRTFANVADDADVSIGLFDVWIPAGGMEPTVTAGCGVFATAEIASNRPNLKYLAFDQTTEEHAEFDWRMPKRWNEGTITFQVSWSHASGTSTFGVAWKLECVAVSDDGTINAVFGGAITVTDTGGTSDDHYQTALSGALTVGGTPAENDLVFFRLSRDPTNGSDDLDADARAHGITLHITTDAGTDD